MLSGFKGMPKNTPQRWKTRADQFLNDIVNEENSVAHRLDNGHPIIPLFLRGADRN